jgi:hypothetical protein
MNNFSFDNIVIGRKIPSETVSKYYMYYNDNNMIKEIYIRLPKLRLIYPMGNNKYSQIKVPIYPNWDVTNNFIEFIQTLENDIISCFEKKKINKELSSLISKKNNFYFIKTNISDDMKISSNTNNKLTLNDFKLNGEIEMVLRISYIWTNNTMIGLSSHLHQIKYYAPPSQLNIDFIDNIIQTPTLKEQTIIPNIEIKKEVIQQPPIKMIPSVKDLQNALKGLKKSGKED